MIIVSGGMLIHRSTLKTEAQDTFPTTSVTGFEFADLRWEAVVNNGDPMPNATVNFSSYGQPSVNEKGLVVFRARSTGQESSGGNRQTGIYLRQGTKGMIRPMADLDTMVPQPNNLDTYFTEFPSIPRIAMNADYPATRGNHRPVYEFDIGEEETTRVGTTGLYMELGGPVTMAVSKLGGEVGMAPGYAHLAVPGHPGLPFDVFPGAPTVADDGTIAFKGNFTVDSVGLTGIFFRRMMNAPGGPTEPIQRIASSETLIPNLPPGVPPMNFGWTSPPTIAGNKIAFLGGDNEDDPSYGGIYLTDLATDPLLTPIATIGEVLPGTGRQLTSIGEAVSFDGNYIAFWGAWGEETKTVRLYCPEDGSTPLLAFCNSTESGSIFDDATQRWFQEREVPVNQGIFVVDIKKGVAYEVANTEQFDDFVFWGFSGKAPGTGGGGGDEGGGDDDAEPPRWRAASFLALSDGRVAFKARTGEIDDTNVYLDPVDGIYLGNPTKSSDLFTIAETGFDGSSIDPEIPVGLLPIIGVGIERDGFRGKYLTLTVSMALETEDETEELTDWAGIYVTSISGNPRPVKAKNK
jgi:hypothetical protein